MKPIVGSPRAMAAVFLAVVTFCVLSFLFFDIPLARFAQTPPTDVSIIFGKITMLGRSTAYLVTSCLLYLVFAYVRKNTLYAQRALLIFLSIAVSGLVTDGLKAVFSRFRPKMFYQEGLFGFNLLQFHTTYEFNSFPSGHATTVGALAAALWAIRPAYGIAGTILALLVMASRIVLGSHFLSDVVFGAYVGFVTATFISAIIHHRDRRDHRESDGAERNNGSRDV